MAVPGEFAGLAPSGAPTTERQLAPARATDALYQNKSSGTGPPRKQDAEAIEPRLRLDTLTETGSNALYQTRSSGT